MKEWEDFSLEWPCFIWTWNFMTYQPTKSHDPSTQTEVALIKKACRYRNLGMNQALPDNNHVLPKLKWTAKMMHEKERDQIHRSSSQKDLCAEMRKSQVENTNCVPRHGSQRNNSFSWTLNDPNKPSPPREGPRSGTSGIIVVVISPRKEAAAVDGRWISCLSYVLEITSSPAAYVYLALCQWDDCPVHLETSVESLAINRPNSICRQKKRTSEL